MVGIEGIGGPMTGLAGRRQAARASGGFRLPAGADTARQATAAAATQESLPASMLVLQELNGETLEDRRARRHGQDVLALLARLQRDVLAGTDDGTSLARLADLAASAPCATDPRLAAVISAILLRVRVELARRSGGKAP